MSSIRYGVANIFIIWIFYEYYVCVLCYCGNFFWKFVYLGNFWKLCFFRKFCFLVKFFRKICCGNLLNEFSFRGFFLQKFFFFGKYFLEKFYFQNNFSIFFVFFFSQLGFFLREIVFMGKFFSRIFLVNFLFLKILLFIKKYFLGYVWVYYKLLSAFYSEEKMHY